jgi:periplasmic protein TonB
MRVTISGKTMAQKVKTRVPAVYPAEAKRKGIQGIVRLHVVITTTGSVTEVQVVSGAPALVHSAIDAVKQWIYEPMQLNGQAVEVNTVVDVNYELKP